jgi:glycosyltransferase involved in cell wall biosynthesis
MKVAVVTPTIGAKTLSKCIQSVEAQTYENLTHYVFLDGEEEHGDKIWNQLQVPSKVKTIRLQENIGKGWYGHRVYAACGYLVNADVVCYLDEDNWFEPNHVEKLVERIKKGVDWAYSLRKIVDKEGNFVAEDNCESLGQWPIYFNKDAFHIDTSSFMVKADIARKIGQAWYGQWGADRQFFNALKQYFPNFSCSREYSLCYRLDGNPNSVNAEFFEKGNAENAKQYPDGFPWKTQFKEEYVVGPGITIVSG